MRYLSSWKFVVLLVFITASGVIRAADADALHTFHYGYHGMLVDREGKEIVMNSEALVATQNYYLRLLSKENDGKLAEEIKYFSDYLRSAKEIPPRERAHIRAVLIEVLVKKLRPKTAERLLEKNQALKRVINYQYKPDYELKRSDRILISQNTISNMKKSSGSTTNAALNAIFEAIINAFIQLLNDFLASNTDYQNECIFGGVPVPPDWNGGDWNFNGELTDEFIASGSNAMVYTYNSSSPRGACVALPRLDNPDTTGYFGVICLGETSENACFWDSFGININDQFRIQDRFFDGVEMASLGGGPCTDCHAGENPFVARRAPSVLNFDNLNVRSEWYTPLGVLASWPQNTAPGTLLDSVDTAYTGSFWSSHPGESCIQCHKLPDVSQLPNYCNSVLKKSAQNTMPSENDPAGWSWPNSSDYRKHIKALRQACP